MRLRELCATAFLGGLIICLGSVAPARASFIATETTNVVAVNPSLYFYSYTVTVSAASTSSVSEFDLALSAPILDAGITFPMNFFSFYTSGDPFITFTAFDNGAPFIGIAPGSSGTFSFYSNYAPGAFGYQASGFDTNSGTPGAIQGTTLAPSLVPEPASLLMSGLGLCMALGLGVRSRRSAVVAG